MPAIAVVMVPAPTGLFYRRLLMRRKSREIAGSWQGLSAADSRKRDVTRVNREGNTTVDMANGPVQRTQPYPETIKLLEGLGAKNNHRCVTC